MSRVNIHNPCDACHPDRTLSATRSVGPNALVSTYIHMFAAPPPPAPLSKEWTSLLKLFR
ncbi:hypothetical protein SCLCIDRAFT_1104057 [Scleroderma citrinum Foug A]|uniref:Uncharacterized protein n=1 Tax=Scleroderma citrinum Foug A TaxID=1036808 RepID=A0A0C3DPR7_9AGAM|nr:hypothetical protein SCLCIDRAFT_1104057 [Scleroderma citrinum Foug A]